MYGKRCIQRTCYDCALVPEGRGWCTVNTAGRSVSSTRGRLQLTRKRSFFTPEKVTQNLKLLSEVIDTEEV